MWARENHHHAGPGVVELLGARLRVVETDGVLGHHLAADGFWEAWLSLAIARRLSPGMRCLDAGANVGYYTALMRRQVGETGTVLAIEPSQNLCGLLRQSIEESGWLNVNVLPVAIGEKDGTDTLWVCDGRSLNGSLIEGWCGYRVPVECEVRTLATIAAGGGRIDFAKIDVDSAEEDLWLGGRDVLRGVGVVVLEVRADRYAAPEAFLAEIRRVFPVLRVIEFDGSIQRIGDAEICGDPASDYLLWLER
jgi:FkbM family methyltransferase